MTKLHSRKTTEPNDLVAENRRETGGEAVQNSIKHRWRPGQSGNPGGRPKMGALARACRDVLEQPVPGDPAGRTHANAIAERLAELGLKGHMGAIRELADRAEGRAGQLLNVEIRPVPFEAENSPLEASITVLEEDPTESTEE